MQSTISSEDCKGKLYGYVRVSGDKQEMSPEIQTRNLITWANGQETEVFVELDVSARLQDFEKRPMGRKLLAKVQRGDWIVATKLDRLFRRNKECEFIERMEQRGVQFHAILEPLLNGETAIGKFLKNISLAVGQLECDKTSERTKEAMAYQRANGLPLTGAPPYGKKIEHNTLEQDGKRGAYFVTNEEELELIAEAAERRLAGELCREIAANFQLRGLKTTCFSKKRGEFCEWTRVRVSRATNWWFEANNISPPGKVTRLVSKLRSKHLIWWHKNKQDRKPSDEAKYPIWNRGNNRGKGPYQPKRFKTSAPRWTQNAQIQAEAREAYAAAEAEKGE